VTDYAEYLNDAEDEESLDLNDENISAAEEEESDEEFEARLAEVRRETERLREQNKPRPLRSLRELDLDALANRVASAMQAEDQAANALAGVKAAPTDGDTLSQATRAHAEARQARIDLARQLESLEHRQHSHTSDQELARLTAEANEAYLDAEDEDRNPPAGLSARQREKRRAVYLESFRAFRALDEEVKHRAKVQQVQAIQVRLAAQDQEEQRQEQERRAAIKAAAQRAEDLAAEARGARRAETEAYHRQLAANNNSPASQRAYRAFKKQMGWK
jgi:hypothetical protein